MRTQTDYSQQTDTHLAKRYNDALFDCIMRCNMTGYLYQSQPHYHNLEPYFAAIHIFYKNTFFLFEEVKLLSEDKNHLSLSELMMSRMDEIKETIRMMRESSIYRKPNIILRTGKNCDDLHMMIMYGLQKRKMLVRMSDREPTGKDSINYWGTKSGFRKGDINHKLKVGKIGI